MQTGSMEKPSASTDNTDPGSLPWVRGWQGQGLGTEMSRQAPGPLYKCFVRAESKSLLRCAKGKQQRKKGKKNKTSFLQILLPSPRGPQMGVWGRTGSTGGTEQDGGARPQLPPACKEAAEVRWQLAVEALNPVAAMAVGLRQAEHALASFPATPD